MLKLIDRLLVMLVFGWAGSASATMMAPVAVDGREWLQPLDFINLSWNDIASACDSTTGDCAAQALGNVGDMDQWTWAGVDDVNGLIDLIVGNSNMGPGADSEHYPTGTTYPLFISAGFFQTGSFLGNFFGFTGIQGWTRTLVGGSDTCNDPACSAYVGQIITWAYNAGDDTNTSASALVDAPRGNTGAWFFRDAQPASIPSAAALVSLALVALGYSRRSRKKRA